MKIKIVKSTPELWYHDKIGKVYHARTNEFLPGRYIVRNYRTIIRTIDINDAEIIEQ